MVRSTPYDLLIIGGGINGCGIAADASGRGLSVLLAEKGDLAGATSSASSKLIHGGLRYLEHYEFRLVRESLQEREVLLGMAPHIVWPLRFLLPHAPGQRPAWMLRTGLFIYDHLASRKRIPGSASVTFASDPAGAALADRHTRGFSYWDCWVDDARLVVLNARSAAARGAEIETRTAVTGLRRDGGIWRVTLATAGGVLEVAARAVVNAAGPWTEAVARLAVGNGGGAQDQATAVPRLRLVRGSHIVVPRIPGGRDAFLFQSPDGRVVFALPFEGAFTLIGTTDVPHAGGLDQVAVSDAEVAYLLAVANAFLRRPLAAADIVWRFAGVRPLDDADGDTDPSSVTRDYRLEVSWGEAGAGPDGAPLLNVIGGKITTFRRLAEAAMDKLAPAFPAMGGKWTADTVLPGGELAGAAIEDWAAVFAASRPGLEPTYIERVARRHGALTADVLGDATRMADLGAYSGGSLYAREIAYLRSHEWAREADDVLWRRTRTGLHLTPGERQAARENIARLL